MCTNIYPKNIASSRNSTSAEAKCGWSKENFFIFIKKKKKKKVGDLRFFFFFGGDRTEGGLGTKKGFGTLLVF